MMKRLNDLDISLFYWNSGNIVLHMLDLNVRHGNLKCIFFKIKRDFSITLEIRLVCVLYTPSTDIRVWYFYFELIFEKVWLLVCMWEKYLTDRVNVNKLLIRWFHHDFIQVSYSPNMFLLTYLTSDFSFSHC